MSNTFLSLFQKEQMFSLGEETRAQSQSVESGLRANKILSEKRNECTYENTVTALRIWLSFQTVPHKFLLSFEWCPPHLDFCHL
jgi:hypothetical protein